MYGYKSWTIKKAEHQIIDAFVLWCWRRLLRVPWTARRSNQSILKGNQSRILIGRIDANAVAPVFWPPDAKRRLIRKCPVLERLKAVGEGDNRRQDGWTEVGWHHWLNGHEFGQAPDGEGEGSLACFSPWGHKESDTTKWLKNINKKMISSHVLLIIWPCYFSHQVVGAIFPHLEFVKNIVAAWPIKYDRSNTTWFLKLGHKNIMYFALLSWDADTWNLATMLWGTRSRHMAL